MGQFVANGSARLYYDNSKKIRNNIYSIDVTGEVKGDTLNMMAMLIYQVLFYVIMKYSLLIVL